MCAVQPNDGDVTTVRRIARESKREHPKRDAVVMMIDLRDGFYCFAGASISQAVAIDRNISHVDVSVKVKVES